MGMRKLIISAVVAVAGFVMLAGPASAAPKPKEAFVSVQDINGSGGGPVDASGLINDQGQDVVVTDTEDTFVFPDGQITVFHSPRHTHQGFKQKNGVCTFSFTERGSYVFGNGTGVWAGYNGSGNYVVKGSGTGLCDSQESFGSVTISASGPIEHADATDLTSPDFARAESGGLSRRTRHTGG